MRGIVSGIAVPPWRPAQAASRVGGLDRRRLARALDHEVKRVARFAHGAPDTCRGPDRRRNSAGAPALGLRNVTERRRPLADGKAGAAQVIVGLGIEAVALGDRVDARQSDLRIDHGLEALERERGEADRRGHGNEPHGDAHLHAEGAAVA